MTVSSWSPAAARHYIGLAGDTKPATNVNAGDLYYATDTGVWSIYDGAAWQPYKGPVTPAS